VKVEKMRRRGEVRGGRRGDCGLYGGEIMAKMML
jgi:hypothetical protein